MKAIILLVFLHLISNPMPAQHIRDVPATEINITTPRREPVRFWLLEEGGHRKILDGNAHTDITSRSTDGQGHPLYRFEDGSVLYRHFINGGWHYFESLRDFQTCYDPSAYLRFAVKYTKDMRMRCYYYAPNGPLMEEMLQGLDLEVRDSLDFPETRAYALDGSAWVHLLKPALNFGEWFASRHHLDEFIKDYYDTTEYVPAERAAKILHLGGGPGAQVLRLSAKEARRHCRDLEERAAQLAASLREGAGPPAPFPAADGGHMLAFDENIWLLSETEAPLQRFRELEAGAPGNAALTLLARRDAADRAVADAGRTHLQLQALLAGLDPARLDYSPRSLEYLEEAVNRHFMGNHLQGLLELPLALYVGEVWRRLHGGRWETAAHGEYWMPVVAAGGKRHEFLIDLIGQLNEQEYSYHSLIAFF